MGLKPLADRGDFLTGYIHIIAYLHSIMKIKYKQRSYSPGYVILLHIPSASPSLTRYSAELPLRVGLIRARYVHA